MYGTIDTVCAIDYIGKLPKSQIRSTVFMQFQNLVSRMHSIQMMKKFKVPQLGVHVIAVVNSSNAQGAG
jgi:hypothetical protein